MVAAGEGQHVGEGLAEAPPQVADKGERRDRKEKDGDGYFIREGLVIVPKNGIVPDGTVI